MLKSVNQASDVVVKISYRIVHELAVSSKLLHKEKLMNLKDINPGKCQAFANVILSRILICRKNDLSKNFVSQLKSKVKCFTAFSVTIDDSTDVCDVAQLSVFIHCVDDSMKVREDFMDLLQMKL